MGGLKVYLAEPSRHAPIELGPTAFGIEEVSAYASLTGDANPIHLDSAFAASRALGGTIVHGTLLVAPIWQALTSRFGMEALVGAQVECKFIRPVHVGALVYIRGDCTANAPDGMRYSFTLRTEESPVNAAVDVFIPRLSRRA